MTNTLFCQDKTFVRYFSETSGLTKIRDKKNHMATLKQICLSVFSACFMSHYNSSSLYSPTNESPRKNISDPPSSSSEAQLPKLNSLVFRTQGGPERFLIFFCLCLSAFVSNRLAVKTTNPSQKNPDNLKKLHKSFPGPARLMARVPVLFPGTLTF